MKEVDTEMREEVRGPYRGGEVHVLEERCATCIFRTPEDGQIKGLEPGRIADLIKTNLEGGAAVPCHSTVYEPDVEPAVCRGFYDRYADQVPALRLARSLGVIALDPAPRKD